jgi:hypothetical protein
MTRTVFAGLGILIIGGTSASAQAASPLARKYPPVCAQGVKVFEDIKQVPTPHDTIRVPPPEAPIRVTNEAEAEAAELALRGRAGSVGATGILVATTEEDNGGMVTRRRSVTGIFIRADSATAQKACAK